MAQVELRIYTPRYRFTIGTGSIEGASPEILLKVKCICSIHVHIAHEITVTSTNVTAVIALRRDDVPMQ